MNYFLCFFFIVLYFVQNSLCIDNGLGLTPPMGWRSWNQFQCDGFPANGEELNQNLLVRMVDALVDKSRKVDGTPTSLLEIGFTRVGLDDCWQLCNSGPGGKGWHDANGNPIVNKTRFPDFNNLTDYAHKMGVKAGWYMNNCHCASSCSSNECFAGDAKAVAMYGFDSVKLDGCSAERNVALWAQLLNKTGRPIMIENCHNGPNSPDPAKTSLEQPFNFFRSSDDIRPTFGSVLSNLQTVRQWVKYVGPGCWTYPDMLEVGVTNTQSILSPLSFVEARTHFGAWCTVSSPLILGFDMTDMKVVDEVWDIITNREAIAVNQAWVEHPGDLVAESSKMVEFSHCSWGNNNCSHPSWQIWAKPTKKQSGSVSYQEVAVLLMNNDQTPQDIIVNFKALNVVCSSCKIRDIWNHKDLGNSNGQFIAKAIPSHDSVFILIQNP